jgi:hypothetical protein
MKFSTFKKSILSNIISFRNYEAIKNVDIVNYYTDDAIGNIKKKEYRWSFDNNYWSSWAVLSQSNISGLNTNNNYYLFLEIRYEYTGDITNLNNVNNFSIDCIESKNVISTPPTIETSSGSTHIHVYEQVYSKPDIVVVNNANLLNSLTGEYYLNRSNHIGTQPINSIDNLSTILQELTSNLSVFVNIGAGDVSIYYGKTQSVHEFRELKAGSNHIIMSINEDNTILIDTSLGDYDASIANLYNKTDLLTIQNSLLTGRMSTVESSMTYVTSSLTVVENKVILIESSLNALINKVNIIDASLNVLTNKVNLIDVSLNLLTNKVNLIDVSLNLLTNKVNVIDVSLNSLTNRVNVIDVSLNVLTNRYNITEASLGALTIIIDSSLLSIVNKVNVIDTSLYILTNRHNVTEASLWSTNANLEFLGSDVGNLKSDVSILRGRHNVTETSLGIVTLNQSVIDSSLLVLTNRYNKTESSLGNLTDVRFDASILFISNRLNTTDSSLTTLLNRHNVAETSLGLVTTKESIIDSSLLVLTNRYNKTESSLGNLTSVKFDASILALSNKINIIDSSLTLLTNRHNITEASLGHLTLNFTINDTSLYTLTNKYNITEASLGHLTLDFTTNDVSLYILTNRHNITEASLGLLNLNIDSSILIIFNRLSILDSSLLILTNRHNITEASLNLTNTYALGVGAQLTTLGTDVSILRGRHNITEASLGIVALKQSVIDSSLLTLTSRHNITESSLGNQIIKEINDISLIYAYTDASLLKRDSSINWLISNKLNGVNNIDSCTGSLSSGRMYSYTLNNISYFKKLIVDTGIIISEDVSTIRFTLSPTSYRTSFFADNSSFVYYPQSVHTLGNGPFVISLFENNDQVYVNNNIDASGNVTLSWIQGNLLGTCKLIISL